MKIRDIFKKSDKDTLVKVQRSYGPGFRYNGLIFEEGLAYVLTNIKSKGVGNLKYTFKRAINQESLLAKYNHILELQKVLGRGPAEDTPRFTKFIFFDNLERVSPQIDALKIRACFPHILLCSTLGWVGSKRYTAAGWHEVYSLTYAYPQKAMYVKDKSGFFYEAHPSEYSREQGAESIDHALKMAIEDHFQCARLRRLEEELEAEVTREKGLTSVTQ